MCTTRCIEAKEISLSTAHKAGFSNVSPTYLFRNEIISQLSISSRFKSNFEAVQAEYWQVI